MQFTANPWLAGYMSSALGLLTPDAADDFAQVAGRLAEFVRSRGQGPRIRTPTRRASSAWCAPCSPSRSAQALDQLLVLGTLLEGHADHVMDAVGPVVVPSVAAIRRRFDERRQRKQPPLQRLLRALLGLDAKLSQYTRGKAFVDHVVDRVGMDRFNTDLDGPGDAAAARRDRRSAAMDRPGAVAAAAHGWPSDSRRTHLAGADRWCVALSGGPDSLALDRGRGGRCCPPPR